jgi:general secretion pathway protein E/type IV pilus assembly protein PilB
MGVEPYLVASSLEAVLAQRLIRIICKECKTQLSEQDTDGLRKRYGDMIPETLYKGAGCKKCQGTGYLGRQGIFEQMVVSEEIRTLLLQNATARDIRIQAMKEGMRDLRRDAARYLNTGQTTVDEVLRVTKDAMKLTIG